MTVAKNLLDINQILMDQLLAVTNTDLKGAELDEELKRSKAVSDISGRMIDLNKTVISAVRVEENIRSGKLIGTKDGF